MSKVNAEIVNDYLKRFPKIGALTLAKKIYIENPQNFNNIDQVRSMIRIRIGSMGKAHRDVIKDKSLFRENRDSNPFYFIPQEHNDPPKIWKLPKSFKRVFLISDIHIPYHSTAAIKAAFSFAKKEGIDCVYINGDLLDFYALSFHEKDPRKRPMLVDELKMGREFLKGLVEYFKVPVYFKPANHEYRLERYLVIKAPELLDCEEFRLDILLRLGEMGVQYIGRRDKCYFGKLLVEHGDRIKGNGGVNPARTLFLRYKRHTICGHFHRKSEHSAKIYDSQSIVTYSVASLCDLEPEYFEVNEHVNGFAIVNMTGDEFRVSNYTIENGKVF